MSELKLFDVDYIIRGTTRLKAMSALDAEESVKENLEWEMDQTTLMDNRFEIEAVKEVI